MSYSNPVPTDSPFSFHNTATQLNTFTTEANLQATYPEVIIPINLFANLGSRSQSLHVKATMRLGTTGSPTFTWSLRLLTTSAWSAGGVLLGSTAALTAGATVTLAPCFLDASIGLKSLGVGATSTLRTSGEVRGPLALASPFSGSIPASNTSLDVATFDNGLQYYLFLSVACSASNALNLIQLESLKVYGDN